jgi:hypothetical protein
MTSLEAAGAEAFIRDREVNMKGKRTEITIETDRVWFISSPRKVVGWCVVCDTEAELLPVDEAALLRCVSSRTIFQWVETQQVHASENANGLLLICLKSLSDNTTLDSATPRLD